MFNKQIAKYILIAITAAVAIFGIYKTVQSFSAVIELKLLIYSDCLVISDAEVSYDGEVKGKTNSSGEIQFKVSFDDDSEKQVKISVGGLSWIENIKLSEEYIGKVQERVIYFRQLSTDVNIIPSPENISYTIMDLDTKCELYSNQIGSSVIRMIIDRPYQITFSMDPEFNTNLFSKRYTPIGIEDGVQFSIYELTILPGVEELSYEISENGKTVDFGFGSDKFYYSNEKNIIIKPYKGKQVEINIQKEKWKYVAHINGEKLPDVGDLTANIRVSNPAANWKIIDRINNEEIINGQGDYILENLRPGKYVLKEKGKFGNLRTENFIITMSKTAWYINLDLRRLSLLVIPYPNDVKWEIGTNRKSILKRGRGSETVKGLAPGSYTARCSRPDGSQSQWKRFKLIKHSQVVELECFTACTVPYINIQLTPVSTSWEIEKSDGKSDYVSFKTGSGSGKIKAELGQLYRLTATYNNIKRVSDIISFTSSHKACRETIDIDMSSNIVLLDEACANNDWSQVLQLNQTTNIRDYIKCHHYMCLAQAFSEDGADEKALDIILTGWDEVDEKQLCLDFHTDEQFIYMLLLLIEKYGLGEKQINEKNMNEKIEIIKDLPLGPNTELKAVYVYLKINISYMKKNQTKWDNSGQDFKDSHKQEYCDEITDLINGEYSIERLDYLMNHIGSYPYSNQMEEFQLRLNKIASRFKCP